MSLKKLTYSEAKRELEEIIMSLENADVDVDVLSVHVKRATQLINHCRSKLLRTERDVKKILDDFEKSQEKGQHGENKEESENSSGPTLFT